jgi:C-terminal processing protease CtpA/Prc
MASSSFINQCQNPRAGQDPTNNNQPYPDMQGSTLDENNFLRSFSDETYLWYDEIVDRDPAGFNNPIDYFAQLKTFQTLPSGQPKDPDSFHYAVDSLEWFNQTQGGVSFGYGVELAVISGAPPRQAFVAYTEPNSPATNLPIPIQRGAELLAVDGIDFVNDNTSAGLDIILEGLFPTVENVPHTFTIRDFGAANSRQVTMTSTTITNAMVQETQVFDTPTGKVGYMVFNFFRAPAEEELIDAINQLIAEAAPDPVDDLILDLRYNGGGFGIIASQLAYMIAGPANTNGRTFDLIQFNDKNPVTNPVTDQPISPDPFLDTTSGFFTLPGGQALPTLNLSRVFVLTGFNTASASELVMNGLRGVDVQVIQVGQPTRGKPYGFYETPNCGTSYFTVQFRSVNDKGWGDYAEGFIPSAVDDGMANVLGCTGISDDYSKQLGDPGEDRLEVALAYQAGLACITPAASAGNFLSNPLAEPATRDGTINRSLFDSNRILLRPADAH